MKICLKLHARIDVMLNMASKVAHFPLSRWNKFFFAQHRAESPPQKWWFWSQFGYGNIVVHTIFAKIVLRKCASHRGRGARFHKICKKLKKNDAKKHQKWKFLNQITEIAKMNCKSWVQKRPQIEKSVPNPNGSNIFTSGKGPGGRGFQGPMHPKVVRNCHFWKHFA